MEQTGKAMNDFECELTDDGDVLVRHVRQGHEYFFSTGGDKGGELRLDRAVKGLSAIDDPDGYADHAAVFAGHKRAFRQ
jgi:hypothetical protein